MKDQVIWNEVVRRHGVSLWSSRYYNLSDRYELSMKDYELEQSHCRLDPLYTEMLKVHRAREWFIEWVKDLIFKYWSKEVSKCWTEIKQFMEWEYNIS